MNKPNHVVAIHQPNFFPWMGYFNKVARCDRFVFLDNVQIPRTGAGSWVNRVRLLIGGGPKWFTLPVSKSGAFHAINQTVVVADPVQRAKLVNSIRMNYRRAPHFDEIFPLVDRLLNDPDSNLAAFNMKAIVAISELLGFSGTRFVRASDLPSSGEMSTDRLVRLVQEVGGTAYLYGEGAAQGYQENERFLAAGLTPMAQSFAHPLYKQFNASEFIPGLSIIDVLMNCGAQGTRNLLMA